ncbi:hypothetical protein [Lysobacter sp. D1-1-M9]|uniref:hypothetical protein n=1 Tax=Novilysobacter longmucuonensis TaxID=3098603 RepID=UPI002FC6B158
MDRAKSLQTLGFIFLAFGASFLAVGVATQMLVFTVLGPSFMALGIVFLATSKVRDKPLAVGAQKPQAPDGEA